MIAESDLKDLGVHTEMYVDAFVDISRAGKINGSKKAIDRGRQGVRVRRRHPEAVRFCK